MYTIGPVNCGPPYYQLPEFRHVGMFIFLYFSPLKELHLVWNSNQHAWYEIPHTAFQIWVSMKSSILQQAAVLVSFLFFIIIYLAYIYVYYFHACDWLGVSFPKIMTEIVIRFLILLIQTVYSPAILNVLISKPCTRWSRSPVHRVVCEIRNRYLVLRYAVLVSAFKTAVPLTP